MNFVARLYQEEKEKALANTVRIRDILIQLKNELIQLHTRSSTSILFDNNHHDLIITCKFHSYEDGDQIETMVYGYKYSCEDFDCSYSNIDDSCALGKYMFKLMKDIDTENMRIRYSCMNEIHILRLDKEDLDNEYPIPVTDVVMDKLPETNEGETNG